MPQDYQKEEQPSGQLNKDIEHIIEEVLHRYGNDNYIKPSMLPDLDLYVDQITTFMAQHLSKTMRYEDDKIMTKTMINNYTKNHLLPPPEKKKYSKDHILLLIFIYYFKNFLPISDIQTILEPLTRQYFHSEDSLNLENIYNMLFSKEAAFVRDLFENVKDEYEKSLNIFGDIPEDKRDYLQQFTFICILSLDIYIKKQLIEEIIDQSLSDK